MHKHYAVHQRLEALGTATIRLTLSRCTCVLQPYIQQKEACCLRYTAGLYA